MESIDDSQLKESIRRLISSYPDSKPVIDDLLQYYAKKLMTLTDMTMSESERKRRKIDPSQSENKVATVSEISFQLPARKKYTLIITSSQLQLAHAKTELIEHAFSLADIRMGVCVPTPEKTAKSFTFALFLNGDSDAIVFNVQDKGDISVTQSGQAQTLGENKHEYICQLLKKHASIQITRPEKKCFASSGVSPTTGKPEERYHVNSYLKTKDGSLFFLPGGILFGFKKPTLFFPLASLASTEITNITQRTFDLTLKLKDGCTALGSGSYTEATVQFSMIEQTEYTAIDAYIKKSNINDTSMSEEKKAPEPKPKKSEQGDNPAEIDEEEQDEDFQPSDEDHDPLEYDTSAESEDDQDADNNDASDMDEDSQHEDNEDEEDEEEENDDENEEDIKEEERADDDEVDLLEDSD